MSTKPPTPTSSGPLSAEEEDYLQSLRRSLAGFLAQNLPFSLFQPGRTEQLKARIHQLVDSKLAEQHLKISPRLHEKLITDIVSGLQTKTVSAQEAPKPAHTEESLRALTAPYLVRHISNDLLQPGHEAALTWKIVHLVDEKLQEDSIVIDSELRKSLIHTICRNMNVPLPDLTPPPAAVPAPPASTTAARKREAEKNATKKISRVLRSPTGRMPSAEGEPEEIQFTDDLRREFLLAIGVGLDPEIMSCNDGTKIRNHILSLMEQYCSEHNFDLEDEIKDLLVNATLNGEGVEFQL